MSEAAIPLVASPAPRHPTFWQSVSNDVRTLAFIFLLPTMVVLTCVVLYPFTYALLLSFEDKTAGIPSRFIGFQNYIELLSDRQFLDVFYNTLWYTVVAVGIKFMIGLASALVLNQRRRFDNIYRTILFIPWAIPTVIASLIWLWVYNEFNGLLNVLLVRLGMLDYGIAWLAEPKMGDVGGDRCRGVERYALLHDAFPRWTAVDPEGAIRGGQRSTVPRLCTSSGTSRSRR